MMSVTSTVTRIIFVIVILIVFVSGLSWVVMVGSESFMSTIVIVSGLSWVERLPLL